MDIPKEITLHMKVPYSFYIRGTTPNILSENSFLQTKASLKKGIMYHVAIIGESLLQWGLLCSFFFFFFFFALQG